MYLEKERKKLIVLRRLIVGTVLSRLGIGTRAMFSRRERGRIDSVTVKKEHFVYFTEDGME